MAYTPNTWHSGDVVTSAKLNNIEQGIVNIGSGVLLVNATDTDTASVLDHTWEEIANANFAVVLAEGLMGKMICPVLYMGSTGGSYTVNILNGMTADLLIQTYTTTSASGYPEIAY